jgi:5-formyltetrahydrofolate cyclo-ligase
MNKSELRKSYIALRSKLPQNERIEKSGSIASRFFESFDLTNVRILHCFIPIEKFNEIDTRIIIAALWNEYPTIQTVVPRVDPETDELVSLMFDRDTQMRKSSWGIDEPAHDEFVAAEEIDMVLVPGICFDQQGHRVGYGKGYYDRFLSKCRPDCVKIGLSFFDPIDQIEDTHDGDIPLDFIVTPERVYSSEPPS